ncbi:N-acetylmuramoyl-L-alanine amidase [Flavisolibacter ginsenosidimutans]|uniref:N-acetylmuramoyl-L-alanine amidase n=1 Tax=Flavisolibacter ginsenosidimutans TaxID=661481 RepID=A0A5B8UM05_9BACT|nr:N-acetylmuramoyl-L-alanine amidase [Flavisolibacter ginsenosidimutans]QEC57711.1 N-acetylmuramoyl-L-alanine amidase [Flavisolibacter ginsenosidimutans]
MKSLRNTLFLSFLTLLLYNCNKNPYTATNKDYKRQAKGYAKLLKQAPPNDSLPQIVSNWVGTTNFNMRKPNFVVIHHTAQNSCDQTLKTFTMPKTQVSAHYVICKDGSVHHMLNDLLRAWHGGVAKWGNNTDINSSSIGIEIDNNGVDSFATAQINTLLQLLANLKKAYAIPAANFIGHEDIAPTRKNDPNVTFPWKKLADAGFGLWWSDTTGVTVPQTFDHLQALRIIGYNIKDTTSVIQTFNRKYLQQEGQSRLSEDGRKILYTLYRKYE